MASTATPDSVAALVPYGWDEGVANRYGDLGSGAHHPGRVVQVQRGACTVQHSTGRRDVASEAPPAVGDWVALGPDGIVKVLERSSVLSRADPGGRREQVLAANLDRVFVVAPGDRLHLARVERELVVAWEGGAIPVVVLTKADLATSPHELGASVQARLVGVDVVLTSAATGEGIDQLAAMLRPHRSAALLGPSGSGKSSLANALVGHEILATGEVRDGDRRGRHTTTTRNLVLVPGGGVLIDTPGLRSLALWRGQRGLVATFADVEELASRCRFRDCGHAREPGCGVLDALAAGDLDEERLASYRKLMVEVAEAEEQALALKSAGRRGRPR